MYLKLLKSGFIVVPPAIYLYYLTEKKNAINALSVSKNETVSKKNIIPTQKYIPVKRSNSTFKHSKIRSIKLAEAFRVQYNAPGLVCAVSHRGKELWSFGQGLADIESRSFCTDESVMRIASISKSMTMLMLGKLLEQDKLDLDKSISYYLDKDKWPDKYFDKAKVDITLRELVSHLGGIRDYKYDEYDYSKEVYLDQFFDSVYESLKLFKNDDLTSKPGTKYLYSTYGFTLISAVIQSVLEKDKKFETEIIKLLKDELRMNQTFVDTNETIIPNRTRYYMKKAVKSQSGPMVYTELINVPEMDSSYKVAGGGLLSNVHDLLKFGNAMLYSYKTTNGILKQEIMKIFWTPNELTRSGLIKDVPFRYGMGWNVTDTNAKHKYGGLMQRGHLESVAFHTGGAVGVTSILLILPDEEIVIAVMTNLKDCPGLGNLSMTIGKYVHQDLNNIDRIKSNH